MTEAKILIVEDEEGSAFYLQYLVRRMGHKPLEPVGTGQDAVDRAIQLRPDLILMDICLEGSMSGIDAARQILDVYQVPIIYLTAVATDDILHDIRDSHPYAYLEKPIQERELRTAIDLALYKHKINLQLQESEQRYRLLFETMSSGFSLQEMVLDSSGSLTDVRFLEANPAFEQMIGVQVSELIGKTLREIMPEGAEELIATLGDLARIGEPTRFQHYIAELNKYLEVTAFTPRPGQFAAVVADVTDQVLSKKAIEESETRFRQLAEGVSEVFWLRSRQDARTLYISPSYERVWGRPVEEVYSLYPNDYLRHVHPLDHERVQAAHTALFEDGTPFNLEYRITRPDGEVRWVWARSYPVRDESGEIIRYSGIAEDITARKASEQALLDSYRRIEQNLMRLTVLRKIDQAITTHTDMVTMASVVLNHITELPEVDAALLFDGHHLPEPVNGGNLRLVGVAGVPLETLDGPALAWLRQQADQAVREKLPIFDANLDGQCPGTIQLKDELGFSVCAFLPVASKGMMMGVLALLGCMPCVTDPDQQQFFQSLALQTAIAMDNVAMFRGIIESHEKLSQAYEATIRGWAGALELRDKETRGHSDRVMRLATRLARRLGMSDEDMVHFQRGVLLHDIGKMAIPDSVLLKPGKLTEEEWILMRQHPRYAYEMLKEIEYLRPALDVPYCHHEKWDGTGYPRGLKGEQIPYMARIFSVVDAWDALTSERPYRPAWTYDDARDYLIKQSGKQFDPQVLQVFLALIAQDHGE